MIVRKYFFFFFLVSIFFFSNFAFSQPSLADFENRAYQKGSKCIPYVNFRNWVTELDQEKNNKQETASSKYNYDSLSRQKKNFIKEYNEGENEIKNKEKEIADWRRDNPLKNAKTLEDELADYKSRQGEIKYKIDSLNNIIEYGVSAWKETAEVLKEILHRYYQIDAKLVGETPLNVLGESYTSDEASRLNKAISKIREKIRIIKKTDQAQENEASNTQQDMYELLNWKK